MTSLITEVFMKLGVFLKLSCIYLKICPQSNPSNDYYREYFSMPKVFDFDDYEQCLLFEGAKYCKLNFKLYPNNTENYVWKTIRNYSMDERNYRHDIIRHGICVSEKFKNINLEKNIENLKLKLTDFYNDKYASLGLKGEVTEFSCESNSPLFDFDFYAYLFIFLMLAYIIIIVFATLYDYLSVQNVYNLKGSKLLNGFSLLKNYEKLTTIHWENPEVTSLASIQGIRFYNMVLVIASHTFLSELTLPISNPLYMEKIRENILIFLQDELTVIHTNFVISYFLLMDYLLTAFNKKTMTLSDVVYMIIYRYFRLTLVLLFVIAFTSTLLPYVTSGFVWHEILQLQSQTCRETWWATALYIHNLMPHSMCLPYTWYLAADMQMFIAILWLLYFCWNKRKRLVVILISGVILQAVFTFSIIYYNNWDKSLAQHFIPEIIYKFQIFSHLKILADFAIKPYRNLAGPLVGLLLGYVYHNYKHQKILINNKIQNVMFCIVTFIPGSLIIFLPNVIMFSPGHQDSLIFTASVASARTIIFSISVAILLFGFTQGLGGVIKHFCELPALYILGRLSYTTYLLHAIIQFIRVGSRLGPVHLTNTFILMEALGDICLSYIGGFILTLFVEMPCCELLKIVMEGSRKKADPGEHGDNRKKMK